MAKITKAAVKRARRKLEPMLQLDLFVDREAVSAKSLAQLRDVERQAREAGIMLLPTRRLR